jgi:hypothetical protein
MSYLTDIERLNYYEGEFLGAVDFQAEQEYHRDMRRRHNLGQHTWGIVTGLQLAQVPNGLNDPNGGAAEADVYLQPGMAVDGFGREIVVLNQYQLTPSMFAAIAPQGNSVQTLQIWIGYQQALLQPSSDGCANMNVSNAYARIQETYTLTVTAQNVSPVDNQIVVNGSPTTPPVPPSSSSSGSSSPPPDPPLVTLPLDDSIPYQEFSTDDTNLTWWLPLGQVLWDPMTGVFVQTTAAIAGYGRQYAGNVSAETYAPAGTYLIVDRNSPNPPPNPAPNPTAGTDPNLGGVSAEVAGTLQVDFLLNAELTALIGATYDTSNQVTRPLTIVDNGDKSLSLIEFRSSNAQTPTWYVSQLGNGVSGLNFGQAVPGSGGKPTFTDGILFFNTGPVGAGNVGVGTTSPSQNLSVYAGINLDQPGNNTGKLDPGLTFGGTDSAGISSNQSSSGNNQSGLDFYTAKSVRMSITQNGNVGIGTGTGSPAATLDVGSGLLHVGGSTNPSITIQGAYLGWNALTGGTGETDFINQQGNGTGAFAFMNVTSSGSALNPLMFIKGNGQVGIGNTSPQQTLSVSGGMNIDYADSNHGGALTPGATNYVLTLGNDSGEGVGSARHSTDANYHGLDFYTAWNPRMTIDNSGNVTVNETLTVTGELTTNGDLWANGYIYVNGGKSAYVVDGFINRTGEKLEPGDVLVVHENPSTEYYGQNNLIPLVEVKLGRQTGDTRVCGIVDQPEASPAAFRGLDRSKLSNAVVGLMVTLGAYAKCKVDADIMPIAAGDLLTTSSTKGHARKLDPDWDGSFGVVIGKALAPLARGKGVIPVLVSHQ